MDCTPFEIELYDNTALGVLGIPGDFVGICCSLALDQYGLTIENDISKPTDCKWDDRHVNSKNTSAKILLMEYQETRSEISEIQRLPEKWGAIMLPLATGILALSVDSIRTLPSIGVIFLVVLSVVTILVWRLIGYNAMFRIGILSKHLVTIESKRTKEEEVVIFDQDWRKLRHKPKSFIPLLSQNALLDIFAFLYIVVGASITIVKIFWF